MRSSRRRFIAGIGAAGAITLSPKIRGIYGQESISIEDVTVIGHRGYSHKYEDNSMKGFREAVQAGVDGIEVDVRQTTDGEIVLSHDPHVLTDNNLPVNIISRVSYETIEDEVVRLKSFLEWFSRLDDMILFIEFKNGNIVDKVHNILVQYKVSDRCVFVSLDESHMKKFPSDIASAYIGYFNTKLIESNFNSINADYIFPYYTPLTVNQNQDTVDGYWFLTENEEDIENALRDNPDYLITNRPNIVIDKLS